MGSQTEFILLAWESITTMLRTSVGRVILPAVFVTSIFLGGFYLHKNIRQSRHELSSFGPLEKSGNTTPAELGASYDKLLNDHKIDATAKAEKLNDVRRKIRASTYESVLDQK